MFGRNRKKRERIIADWASLQDALIGNFDAEESGTGAMQIKVEWKAEGRSQDVTIAYAVAPEIGQIAYITAPIGVDVDAESVRQAMEESVQFLDGGIVIDTPGMREMGLEGADLARTFVDIDELAARCRFRDCTHANEPHCAVQRAIRDGLLSEERLAGYLKLKKEARYEGLNSRQIETEKLSSMFAEIGGIKNARKFAKEKNRTKHGYC